jgi:hypothetical protein
MRNLAPILGTLLLAACTAPGPPCLAGGAPSLRAELFFGLTRPGGAPVTDAEWHDFLAQEVTPRFPEGLTVLDAQGQWLDPQTRRETHEPSRVIVVLAAPAQATLDSLAAVARAYDARFDQQAVYVSVAPACAGDVGLTPAKAARAGASRAGIPD